MISSFAASPTAVPGQDDASDAEAAAAAVEDLITRRKHKDAAMAAARGLARHPGDRGLSLALARVHLAMKRPAAAEGAIAEIVARNPADAEAAALYGRALGSQNKFDAAEAALAYAGTYHAGHPDLRDAEIEVLRRSAALRARAGLKADAAQRLRKAARLLHHAGEVSAAIDAFRAAFEMAPADVDVAAELGLALSLNRQSAEAIRVLAPIAVRSDASADVLAPLGGAYWQIGRLDLAEPALRRALAADANHAAAHINLANVLTDQRGFAEAIALYRRGLALDPSDRKGRFGLACALLASGDWTEGFFHYEAREKPALARAAPGLVWPGPAAGRVDHLTLLPEQGLGDFIHMARYAHLAAAHADRLTLVCPPPLAHLMQSSFPAFDVRTAAPDDMTWRLSIMSAPRVFGTTPETIPWSGPYLRADAALCARWSARLGAPARLRVGLVFGGNPKMRLDEDRSLTAAQMAEMIDGIDAEFINLQRDRPLGPLEGRLRDWMADCADFADTAALIQELDLVIAVDTAVAHLAGALGRPVWMLNRFHNEWRWLTGRASTGWYPSMRLYPQTRMRVWDEPLAAVRRDLQALCAQSTSPAAVAPPRAAG